MSTPTPPDNLKDALDWARNGSGSNPSSNKPPSSTISANWWLIILIAIGLLLLALWLWFSYKNANKEPNTYSPVMADLKQGTKPTSKSGRMAVKPNGTLVSEI